MYQMEKYSKHLESIVGERTQEMMVEKEKADKLLYSEWRHRHYDPLWQNIYLIFESVPGH